jgi:aminoglycoside phosphotransferase (APT) family kinase protein
MGFVDGWSPMGLEVRSDGERPWPAPFDTDLEARRGLAFQLVEGIALLGGVDWQAKGLQDLGRPDGFHDRQVDRWTAFLDRIKGRDLPGFDEAAAWLKTHRPLDFLAGLMHGDYQFANVMYCDGAPARLAAIVDWEMGTVGDPKLDLGWVVQSWPEDTTAAEASTSGYVDLYGMPSKAELLDHYAAVSGRQVDDIDYYVVLARWKLAIVLEQGFQRAGDDEKLLAFGPFVLQLLRDAAELAETTDYGR